MIEQGLLEKMPTFIRRRDWYLSYRPKLAALVARWNTPGADDTRMLAIVRAFRLSRLVGQILDKDEFLSDFGVRSLSSCHRDHPYVFAADGYHAEVGYVPAESTIDLFGGNSNWRGPIWMPINYLIIESLNRFHKFYGDAFKLECPTGSGRMLSLNAIADELRYRLVNIFRRDCRGAARSSAHAASCSPTRISGITSSSTNTSMATQVAGSERRTRRARAP